MINKTFILDEKDGTQYNAEFWKRIRVVMDINRNVVENVVCCELCYEVLEYDRKSTKYIKKHCDKCGQESSSEGRMLIKFLTVRK